MSAQAPAPAAPYRWSNAVVGAGGFAPNLIFSPAERGLAYLRTDMGGAYRWDAAAAQWIPLEDMLAEGSYQGVESLVADPHDPDVVYLAAGMSRRSPAAILRSSDRGRSWDVRPVPFRMGGNEDGRGLGERLAIDPARPSTLFFGSRHDGLFRSDDSGRNWLKVAGFPLAGAGVPTGTGWRTNAGLSFVVFDPSSGTDGKGSAVIYVASADPGSAHLFGSADGGLTWSAVNGAPGADLLPVKGAMDAKGRLFIDYCSGIGPNGIATGAVWRLDTRSGKWTDITPDPKGEGGYMGLSIDASHPGTLVISSVDRWHPGDTVWRSTDAGNSWTDLGVISRRDISAAPWLTLGRPEAEFGHWTAGLAIDPFDRNHIAYTTGATVYATIEAGKKGRQIWTPWVKGIEQTAIISLSSPTGGAHLVSGFGDIKGFVHEDLTRVPAQTLGGLPTHNTNQIDYAGLKPLVLVRSGTGRNLGPDDATLAFSEDGGRRWAALRIPPQQIGTEAAKRYDLSGDASIVTSADGSAFIVNTPQVMITRDRGRSWAAPAGLPFGARVVADKQDPSLLLAIDWQSSRLFTSRDGGSHFEVLPTRGLPDLASSKPRNREVPFPLVADPLRSAHLWLLLNGSLWRSTDGGASFSPASRAIRIDRFGLGKGAENASDPALYATGELGGIKGIFRSVDGGRSWLRINDDEHQWGLRFRIIEGDPRLFGRVYVGTDGRGVIYGDPR